MQNSPARSGNDVGTVIAETYTIEALIGRGGMGAVFMASHRRLPGKKVAIKFLHADLAGEEVLRRFEREAQIASTLGHPNIVSVTDYNLMADGTPYLAPEQATGQHDKVDERTDTFARGAIVYEMLTGQPAFSGANIPEVVFKDVYEQPADLATLAPATPPAVLAAVSRAMEKKADDRFATIADFVEALTGQPLAVVRPRASLPPGDGGPGSRGGSRRPPGSSGSRTAPHSTGREACAATVGSGDHAHALAATSAPPAAAKSAPPDAAKSAPPDAAKSAPPDAPTAASAAGAPVAPTAASTAGAPVAPPAASVSGAPVAPTAAS